MKQKKSGARQDTEVDTVRVVINDLVTGGDELLGFGEALVEAIEDKFGLVEKLAGGLCISLEDVNADIVAFEEGVWRHSLACMKEWKRSKLTVTADEDGVVVESGSVSFDSGCMLGHVLSVFLHGRKQALEQDLKLRSLALAEMSIFLSVFVGERILLPAECSSS